ncbi:MAG: heavy metal translocating P-type ATPase [Candidatus Sumerlaeaceae bacterium]|nr:heavy metal translocating P-type ATPase [Candidatus Sumerlaeaceae bacterium]
MSSAIPSSNVTQTRLLVDGMHCASCVGRVEKGLAGLDGVKSASVNLATGEARVEFDPDQTNSEAIMGRVEAIGYKARPVTAETAAAHCGDGCKSERPTKLIVGGILALPVMVVGMMHIHFPYMEWMMLALTVPVVFWSGSGFFTGAWKALKRGTADMNTLVAMGAGTAFVYSVVATVAPQLWHGIGKHPDVYYEAAAGITILILLGRYLEDRARARTSGAIQKLLGQAPDTARVARGSAEVEVSTASLQVGDLIVVRPGERIATDGVIEDGQSAVDESMITGEGIPVEKGPGAEVIGGTINKSGSFRFRATAVGADTALRRIVNLVSEAQTSKAPIARLADRISGVFVPVVVAIAVMTLVAWLVFGGWSYLGLGVMSFVTVLIISCPCAMGLATPMAVMTGTGRGAELGILIRGGEALEKAHGLNVVVLDKTGTITRGHPDVVELIPASGFTRGELLQLAASAESRSEHPFAEAIMRVAAAESVSPKQPESFVAREGFGIEAVIDAKKVLMGSSRMLQSSGVALEAMAADAERHGARGSSVIYVAADGVLAGAVVLADVVKETSAEAVRQLKAMGLEVVMITGGDERAAKSVAGSVGIENILANVLPGEKADRVRDFQRQGRRVAMVGDGINDAPALAAADVGIAIGTGTHVAMETSDITLISGDLRGVAGALDLSRQTFRVIKQNLFWAFFYNVLCIPVAAGALYPAYGILLNPIFASVAMALSDLCVVGNSLRLMRAKVSRIQA